MLVLLLRFSPKATPREAGAANLSNNRYRRTLAVLSAMSTGNQADGYSRSQFEGVKSLTSAAPLSKLG